MTNSLLKRIFQTIKLGRPVTVIGLNNDFKSGLVYLKPAHACTDDIKNESDSSDDINTIDKCGFKIQNHGNEVPYRHI